ncbi:hypothetical protein HZH66_003473 [Vespula vulgaris]|uniref:Uncharacterized protein n=1 Tax=Vespula vulgaris TaxID=7454 RepID=A0A834NCV9_VESVU|nr:hypothetical protein HZH66_003473 [Vespula vulgaris]
MNNPKSKTLLRYIINKLVRKTYTLYVRNDDIREALQVLSIQEEITEFTRKYQTKVEAHINSLAVNYYTIA